MKGLIDFKQQAQSLLEHKRQAMLAAILLGLLPFTSILSVAVIALITLRKGSRAGLEILLPAVLFHGIPMLRIVPWDSALLNSLIIYLPCYFAALTLRRSASWSITFGVYFAFALLGLIFIQLYAPEFVINQCATFKKIFGEYQEYQYLIDVSEGSLGSLVMAQLLLGFQVLVVFTSSMGSLLCARAMQARLFMPGGLKKELLDFRSGRLSLLVLIAVAILAYYDNPIALNLLPLILSYFFISGFGLSFYALAPKKQAKLGLLLLGLLVFLKPTFVVFAYIVFGSLDSLFNFRIYLPRRISEST